jgi:hypothetical protein
MIFLEDIFFHDPIVPEVHLTSIVLFNVYFQELMQGVSLTARRAAVHVVKTQI